MKNLKTFDQLKEDAEKSYLMTKTYQVADAESAEAGDYKDQGTEYKDQEFDSIWEIAQEIRDAGATEPSESGSNVKATVHTWWSTPDGDKDMSTGEEKFYSFHPRFTTDEEAQELAALIKMSREEFAKAEPGMTESAVVNEKEQSPFDSFDEVYNDMVALYTLMDEGSIEWMKATDLEEINGTIEEEAPMLDKFESLEEVDKWIDKTLDNIEKFVKIARAARKKK